MKKPNEEIKKLLTDLVEHYDGEDREVRERQIRIWRKLKLYWEGFTTIWYSEVAHDWRIYDESQSDDSNQAHYDKQVNIFRAYLESIIAALSVTIPPIKCFPEDADNPLDLLTARAGDKISKLIYRHNDVSLLWLHSLFIYVTEGMVACYTYSKEDAEFGTYEKDQQETIDELHKFTDCSACGENISEEEANPEEPPPDPNIPLEPEVCEKCGETMSPVVHVEMTSVNQIVGKTIEAKSRQCIEAYGGLYVKVANYAKKQSDTPYLMFSYETDYTFVRERYEHLAEKIGPGSTGGSYEHHERWGRANPQYAGDIPRDNITIRNAWFRPAAYHIFNEEDMKKLKKEFPNGVKVVMADDQFAEAESEKLDDYWTLTQNPLSDHLYHDPIGMLLISVQDITNDLISLVLQTIEHGIPQTFADPSVLNFDAYRNMEATPGSIVPATPKSGKGMGDAFYEVKTATLSPEILPFAQKVQEFGQLVSGALPSLFGGQMTGSKTASEYSMSRAQALQRLQNTWKIFTVWWKQIFAKAIPGYIRQMKEDEKFVETDEFGNFVNVFIRKAEVEGKIGKIELEANENLPITWAQKKDVFMELLQANNPEILALIGHPENLPMIYEAIGIDGLHVPNEDDRNKQYDEIKQLLNSEPIPQPISPEQEMEAMQTGQEAQPVELPSVEVDQVLDNHQVEFEICRKWLISEVGRQAKIEMESGYRNVLLHAMQHHLIIQQQMMAQAEQQQQEEKGSAPLAKKKTDMSESIKGEEHVSA